MASNAAVMASIRLALAHDPQAVAHAVIGGDVHVRRAAGDAVDDRIHGG
jgi:hypothetical protein